jgi:hypothetical protein
LSHSTNCEVQKDDLKFSDNIIVQRVAWLPGRARSSGRAPSLASALAPPLEHSGQTVCVLTLYRNQKDAFAAHELVSLLPLAALFANHTTDLASLGASVSADSPALGGVPLNRELNGVGRYT